MLSFLFLQEIHMKEGQESKEWAELEGIGMDMFYSQPNQWSWQVWRGVAPKKGGGGKADVHNVNEVAFLSHAVVHGAAKQPPTTPRSTTTTTTATAEKEEAEEEAAAGESTVVVEDPSMAAAAHALPEMEGVAPLSDRGHIGVWLQEADSSLCVNTFVQKGDNEKEPDLHICLDHLPKEGCVVYSIGINNIWDFDDFLLEQGCEVFSFDPSMDAKEHRRTPKHLFQPIGIGTETGDVAAGPSTLVGHGT
jgi:hypothetical protein